MKIRIYLMIDSLLFMFLHHFEIYDHALQIGLYYIFLIILLMDMNIVAVN